MRSARRSSQSSPSSDRRSGSRFTSISRFHFNQSSRSVENVKSAGSAKSGNKGNKGGIRGRSPFPPAGEMSAARGQAARGQSPNASLRQAPGTPAPCHDPRHPWDSVSPSHHEPQLESRIFQIFIPCPFNHLPLHAGQTPSTLLLPWNRRKKGSNVALSGVPDRSIENPAALGAAPVRCIVDHESRQFRDGSSGTANDRVRAEALWIGRGPAPEGREAAGRGQHGVARHPRQGRQGPGVRGSRRRPERRATRRERQAANTGLRLPVTWDVWELRPVRS